MVRKVRDTAAQKLNRVQRKNIGGGGKGKKAGDTKLAYFHQKSIGPILVTGQPYASLTKKRKIGASFVALFGIVWVDKS